MNPTESIESQKSKASKPSPKGMAYASKSIYHNYMKIMQEKNRKRLRLGLKALYIRSYEEWYSQ